MDVACPKCGTGLAVPEYRASNPDAALRCRACNSSFTMAQGQGRPDAVAPPQPAAAAPARPVPPAARPPVPRPSTGAQRVVAAPAEPAWQRCSSHPEALSVSVCGNCVKGYCSACTVKVRGALVCPACDGLASSTEEYRQARQLESDRSRPLWDDLGMILAYPFVDKLAFVLLALFTWFFGALARFAAVGGGIGILFSQGVLYWYCFSALSRVASGNLKDVMPEFRDVSDLVQPLRLGLCALLIASGPLLLLTLAVYPGLSLIGPSAARLESGGVVHAQGPTEDAEPEPEGDDAPEALATPEAPSGENGIEMESGPGWGPRLLLALALLWQLVYTPVALTVAGLSRSMLSTLNPLLGIDTIGRMGATYWQSAAIYTGLALAQGALGFGLAFVPFLGGVVTSFVDAYAFLAVGCTLGLAVHKKARELGYD